MDKKEDILPDSEIFEKEAPLLHSISKENPFSVPGKYFDMLPSQIIERCRTESKERKTSGIVENLRLFVLGYKWRLLTITGCVAILCFFTIHINNKPISYQAMAQNIPDSLIVAHLDKNVTDINLTALEDISAEAQTTNVPSTAKTASDSTANTDQDIIAYLINTNVTVSDIENEP